MRFLPELYYFYDVKDFDFKKALFVTGKKVGELCVKYEANLLMPVKEIKNKSKSDNFSFLKSDKNIEIENLLKWILENSESCVFKLFLFDENNVVKFEHNDDTCCWFLNLTEEEFIELQKAWKEASLPEDLFYREEKEISLKSSGFFGKLFNKLGLKTYKIYTPKRWEQKNRN